MSSMLVDLVGVHLDLAALVAHGGLPPVLAQTAGDDDPVAIGQVSTDGLGGLGPDDDVEEVRLVGVHPVDDDRGLADRCYAVGESQLGVGGKLSSRSQPPGSSPGPASARSTR